MQNLHPISYRADIDGLRAVAVSAVVLFHAFPDILPGGFVGVDIFFVISGYLISLIIFKEIKNKNFSFMQFYSRRIRRIFPALLLVLASCYGAGYLVLFPIDFRHLGIEIASSAAFIQNFFLWSESSYFYLPETHPLLHLWSLGVEEQFYIIWPFLLWVAYKTKLKLLWFICLITSISFISNIYDLAVLYDQTAAFYSPFSRFWELMLGSLLAYSQIHSSKLWLRDYCRTKFNLSTISHLTHGLTILGLFLILLSLFLFNQRSNFPGWLALLPTLGAMFIITAGENAYFNRRLLANPILVQIGLISYPLYLWHWPVLFFANVISSDPLTKYQKILVIILSIVLAYFTYILIEKPIRFGKHVAIKITILTILMVAVGYLGLNTFQRNGLSFRFPADVIEKAELVPDRFDEHTRVDQCFLLSTNTFTNDGLCDGDPKKPTIFLWGDSHAAALYPGFKNLTLQKDVNIAQYTAATCAPIISNDSNALDHDRCSTINTQVIKRIETSQPMIVILHASWDRSLGSDSNKSTLALESTIDHIKNVSPKSSIVIIGAVPRWNQSATLLYLKKQIHSPQSINSVQYSSIASINTSLDRDLLALANKKSIIYISALDNLCKGNQCLLKVGRLNGDIIASDDAHFTPSGSIYFVNAIKHKIFSGPCTVEMNCDATIDQVGWEKLPNQTDLRFFSKKGEIIRFSKGADGLAYLVKINAPPNSSYSWSNPEDWGVWSLGKRAKLELPMPLGKVNQLTLTANTMVSDAYKQLMLNIFIEDMPMISVVLNKPGGNEILLPLPKTFNRPVNIEIEILNPISPQEIGLNSDIRKLGIGLVSARFD